MDDDKTMTAEQAAAKWGGMSARFVRQLLKEGRVPGAYRANDRNGTWRIPIGTPRPVAPRKRKDPK